MLKIISIILRRDFWTIKGETTPVCLPIKSSDVLLLLLALTKIFVHNSIFVLISRKGQLSLSSCKGLFLFHNCYYHYCQILNFNIYSPLHFENNSMKICKRSIFITIIFIVFLLVDQWTQLCFLRQGIIYHNVFGLPIPSLQWTVVSIV